MSYYSIKPLLPRRVQLALRRIIAARKREKYRNVWPIDEKSGVVPPNWPGWPNGKKFAFVLTHDVERAIGVEKCRKLVEIDKRHGFRSLINFVPHGYKIPTGFREQLEDEGFEIGVHGLNHEGNLFRDRRNFESQSKQINTYLKDWRAVGFRTPSMYHNLEWIHDLDIQYDASTFDTDPFEPQPDGVETIFPFLVRTANGRPDYMEIPYTLPQDHTLFVILRENSSDLWKRKLDWIVERGGMALMDVHPDYINFDGSRPSFDEYPIEYYEDFLEYVKNKYDGKYWHALPREVARYCRTFLENKPDPQSTLIKP